ncbi:hypothetical protein LCGC14_0431320 [marine sediment metagenome]|uniref:Uncharacterized protein n=1 Tax=marine sediment metagenome TaxID=412755 RepID=A0A0F9T6B1_9ZZZZ
MTASDELTRRLLIEQTRKEILDKIKQYQVGFVSNGNIMATKTSDKWDGFIFVIPKEKYQELFEEAI